jgi:hypothetical protein
MQKDICGTIRKLIYVNPVCFSSNKIVMAKDATLSNNFPSPLTVHCLLHSGNDFFLIKLFIVGGLRLLISPTGCKNSSCSSDVQDDDNEIVKMKISIFKNR